MHHRPFTTSAASTCDAHLLRNVGHLTLPEKTVQVWVLRDALVESVASELGHVLSPDERQRARRYKREPYRNRFVARRSALRCLLGSYLDRASDAIEFSVTDSGRPYVQQRGARELAFNVSHTDGMAVMAFAWNCQLGVDVERLIDGIDVAGIGHEVFSVSEERTLNDAHLDPSTTFFRIWTRKEALMKALGAGLSSEAKSFTTRDDSELGEGHWRASKDGIPVTGWTYLDMNLGPQVSGALAVSLEDAEVSVRPCATQ
jgi:4'-phosphopantetheinyl transferase